MFPKNNKLSIDHSKSKCIKFINRINLKDEEEPIIKINENCIEKLLKDFF